MTHGREWTAAASARVRDQQLRPSTSAGSPSSSSSSSLARRPIGVKSDAAGPEDSPESESTRVARRAQPNKAKKKTAIHQEPPLTPAAGQQEVLIDGFRHVTAALRADERQLHEQLLVASEKGSHRAVYLLLHQHLIDKDRCRGMVRVL